MRTLLLTSLIAICLTATVYNIFRGGSEVYKLDHLNDNNHSQKEGNFLSDKEDDLIETVEEIYQNAKNDELIESLGELLEKAEDKGMDVLQELAQIQNNEKPLEEIVNEIKDFINGSDSLTKELIDEIIEGSNGGVFAEEILGEADDEGQCDGEDCNEELVLMEEILSEIEDEDGDCDGEGCNEELELAVQELLARVEDKDEVCEGEECNEETGYEQLFGEDGECEGDDCDDEEDDDISNSEEIIAALPEDSDDDDEINRDFLAQTLNDDDEIDTA